MRVSIATTKAIKYACINFHYSKSVPPAQYAFNVFNDNNEWCGVILYGGGANNNMPKSFGLCAGEVLELVRVALNGKQGHGNTSKAVAMSLKELHKMNPILKMVVSYADHRQEHLGIIYQATNWIYLGVSKTSDTQYFYNGKWTHERTINSKKNKEELKATLPQRQNSDKFKYIYCFDKKLRKQYIKQALPYPKQIDKRK